MYETTWALKAVLVTLTEDSTVRDYIKDTDNVPRLQSLLALYYHNLATGGSLWKGAKIPSDALAFTSTFIRIVPKELYNESLFDVNSLVVEHLERVFIFG